MLDSVMPRFDAREHQRREDEAKCEEREERIHRDRVLDLHERHSPHGGDGEQRDERRHRAAARSQRRRINPENGRITSQ